MNPFVIAAIFQEFFPAFFESVFKLLFFLHFSTTRNLLLIPSTCIPMLTSYYYLKKISMCPWTFSVTLNSFCQSTKTTKASTVYQLGTIRYWNKTGFNVRVRWSFFSCLVSFLAQGTSETGTEFNSDDITSYLRAKNKRQVSNAYVF